MDIKTPFRLEGINRVDDTPVHQALREALANCLVNADYYGRRGVVVIKKPDSITLSNPGNLRIELATALSGGVSDPRNSTMLKMFNFIDIGERAGSGIPNIFRVWREQKWNEPFFSESFDPDRITLTLPLSPINIASETKSAIKIGDKKKRTNSYNTKTKTKDAIKKNIIIYLTAHPEGKTSEIAEFIGLQVSRTRDYMKELANEGIVEMSGANKNRTYRLHKVQ